MSCEICSSCGADDSWVIGTNSVGWIVECHACHYRWTIPTKELTA